MNGTSATFNPVLKFNKIDFYQLTNLNLPSQGTLYAKEGNPSSSAEPNKKLPRLIFITEYVIHTQWFILGGDP